MFNVTFFRDELITVIYPEGTKITRRILDDPKATFVWGELMSPHFIAKLLGSPRPYAPAVVKGFTRKPYKDFFDVLRSSGGVVQGVVLLGLSDEDVRKLNEFEQIGKVMMRRRAKVEIGQRKRSTYIYLRKK